MRAPAQLEHATVAVRGGLERDRELRRLVGHDLVRERNLEAISRRIALRTPDVGLVVEDEVPLGGCPRAGARSQKL